MLDSDSDSQISHEVIGQTCANTKKSKLLSFSLFSATFPLVKVTVTKIVRYVIHNPNIVKV